MIKSKIQIALIILSVFAMINVLFVPMYDVWGGLYGSGDVDNFIDVIDYISRGKNSLWVVQITMHIFVPTAFMLFFSFVYVKGLFISSTIVGIIAWFRIILDYVNQYGEKELFKTSYGNVCIGTWVAIAFFVVNLILGLCDLGRKKQPVTATNTVNQPIKTVQSNDGSSNAPIGQNNLQSASSERNVALIENALKKPHSTEDRIKLLKAAGDAYFNGYFSAPQDYVKAAEFYKEGAELGNLSCLHDMGLSYILAYWGKDKVLFSHGVVKVAESYKKGFPQAKETLQYLLDNNMFPDCKTTDELVEYIFSIQ